MLTDWIFPRTWSVARPAYLGDRIFPDQKTENLKAEYLRLPRRYPPRDGYCTRL